MAQSVYLLFPMMVLLPVVPAYILFKLLKSQGTVNSKAYGFEIQLGGAFAGYFGLLLVLLSAFKAWIVPPPPPTRVVWNVDGHVIAGDHKAVMLTGDNVIVNPGSQCPSDWKTTERFDVSFVADPDYWFHSPTVTVSAPNYVPVELDLDPKGKNVDYEHHVIHITQPITLEPANASLGTVRVSTAQPIDDANGAYKRLGDTSSAAPPPGYASVGNGGPNL